VGTEAAGGIVCTYDDWRYDGSDSPQSLRHAREYIEDYPKNDARFYVVWQDRIGRYKALLGREC